MSERSKRTLRLRTVSSLDVAVTELSYFAQKLKRAGGKEPARSQMSVVLGTSASSFSCT
jgi:hypothetical protein